MKLHYWRGVEVDGLCKKNFGDELNPFLWKRLLGDIFDENGKKIFIGIGSLLNDKLESEFLSTSEKIVFGTGVGYGSRPLRIDDTYKIYCVRGPLSAKALGINEELAITDGALLIRKLFDRSASKKLNRFGYMPHWTNDTRTFEKLCTDAGMFYINPNRDDIATVVQEILSCEVIFAEAMHGAIVADALRIPWVPVKSTAEVIAFKWRDWCSSIDVSYQPSAVYPIWGEAQSKDRFFRMKLKEVLVARQLNKMLKNYSCSLSRASHADTLYSRLVEKLERLKSDLSKSF